MMKLTGEVEDKDVSESLAALPLRWAAVCSEVDKRVECMSCGVKRLKGYEDELHPLGNWLAWGEGELDTLRRRENTSQLVQQQVDKCAVSFPEGFSPGAQAHFSAWLECRQFRLSFSPILIVFFFP